MSRTVNLAGTSHQLPTSNEVDWGAAVSAFLAALPTALGPAVLLFGGSATRADTTAAYLWPGFSNDTIGTTEIGISAPATGQLRKLYVRATTGPTGGTMICTVRKNGVDTSLVATLAADGTTAATTNIGVNVAAGDRISVKAQGGTGISVAAANLTVTLLLVGHAGQEGSI